MFTNIQMLPLVLVLSTTFSESLYLPQNIFEAWFHTGLNQTQSCSFSTSTYIQFPLTFFFGGEEWKDTHKKQTHHLAMQSSTQMEGDGVTRVLMQANLILQGSHDFYFPKCVGVTPNRARAVDSLLQLLAIGQAKKKKWKKIPFSNTNTKPPHPARTDQCLLSPAVLAPKAQAGNAVQREQSVPPSSQHPAMGSGISAFGLADPLNLQHLHSLLPKRFSSNCGLFSPFLSPHHKTH